MAKKSSGYEFVERGEYNKNPMFVLSNEEDDDKRNKFNTFQFGLGKAQAIVEHMDELVAFVESDGERITAKKSKKKTSKKKSDDDEE